MKNYPDHAYKSNKQWLRDVRKRWFTLRKVMNSNEDAVRGGCVYYPEEVHAWISQFEKMDNLMREYYKNA